MDIEVLTTKKKLTKSVITQMPVAAIEDMAFAMQHGTVLGYVKNVAKNLGTVAIMKGRTDYCRVTFIDWKASTTDGTRLYGKQAGVRGEYVRDFSDEIKAELFLNLTEGVKQAALLNHIYI